MATSTNITPSAAQIIADALDQSAEAAFAALYDPRQKGATRLLAALRARTIKTNRHHSGGTAVRILKSCAAFCGVLQAAGFAAHVYSYAD